MFRKGMSVINLLVVMGILILPGACYSGEYKIFFSKPVSKQHDEIKKLSIEEQFDIYIYAMTKRHPPDLGFADDIAANGEKIIPFLIDKLKGEQSESVQKEIIFILERMAWRYEYDVRKNKELINLIEKVTASMKIPYYKERSEKSLKIIKSGESIKGDKEEPSSYILR